MAGHYHNEEKREQILGLKQSHAEKFTLRETEAFSSGAFSQESEHMLLSGVHTGQLFPKTKRSFEKSKE